MSRRNRILSRWTLAIVLTLLPGFISGCKKAATEDEADKAVAVQAEHPSVGPISEQITADAILAPLAQASIAPRISAPIRAEYVQRGAHVRKGQLLIALEDRDLQGSALDSKGAVASAQAAYLTATHATIPEEIQKAQLDVDQARANLEVANRTAEERKRLLQEGAIAGRDTDTAIAAAVQAKAAYETAAKHLQSVESTTRKTDEEAAKGQLTSAQGRLMNSEAQITYSNLRSPIDGVVTDRPLFPGETAPAGSSIITVMDTSSLLAKLHIAQSSAQKLRIGGSAKVFIPGVNDPQAATVALISPALDPGSTTVEVWLKLPNADGRYKVGTPVHTVLQGITIPDAVQVPAPAILPADDGSTNVLIIEPDGTAKKRSVRLGLRTPEKVQIVDGVSPTDLVITEGGYGLDDGSKVKVGGNKEDNTGDKGAGPDDKGAKD
ncbi:efflux RND transporter periplasmic adaptor subunit [Caballeronia sp.]|uniref:efflux RND transporter periplasmic adaptor subunit n=1 Tax=Caballeronia sp. TaxID=1931223 RepID=UPI003C5F7835